MLESSSAVHATHACLEVVRYAVRCLFEDFSCSCSAYSAAPKVIHRVATARWCGECGGMHRSASQNVESVLSGSSIDVTLLVRAEGQPSALAVRALGVRELGMFALTRGCNLIIFKKGENSL